MSIGDAGRAIALTVLAACGEGPELVETLDLVAVTFNTGTAPELDHDEPPDDGYGALQAMYSNDHYGDGLAWTAVIDATRAFLLEASPDVIGFQEIFDPADCANVPPEARPGFVCETWTPGDPTVAELVLGAGYQVACHPGNPDKCVGVRTTFGALRGCTADSCADALIGRPIAGCGNGARVARGVVDLVDGGELVLVNVHGTSGFSSEDAACRVQQVEQVFVDLGDGAPGASGARNLVLGDLNTDPGRFVGVDASADRWRDFVGDERAFAFLTAVGEDAPGSYGGVADIDHVISDAATGACRIAGVTAGLADVTEVTYFDHHPVICDVALRR